MHIDLNADSREVAKRLALGFKKQFFNYKCAIANYALGLALKRHPLCVFGQEAYIESDRNFLHPGKPPRTALGTCPE